MRTPLRIAAALAALALATAALPLGTTSAHGSESHGSPAASRTTLSRATFHDAMRQLWEDHIVWTRQFIVSAATGPSDLADIGPTTERLLANQADIGDAIKPFYGEAAGEQLTALLRDHILTAAEIIAAAKAKDAATLDDASERWYVNGDEIATFLSEANPDNWPLEAMKAHMRSHLDLTLTEAVARLEGRYADDIIAYDAVHADILAMADMLSEGIFAQFPDRVAD